MSGTGWKLLCYFARRPEFPMPSTRSGRASLPTPSHSLAASSVNPNACSIRPAATESPSVLAIAFYSLRALSRYVELFSASSSSIERLSAVYLSSEVTTPVRFSAILAATPG